MKYMKHLRYFEGENYEIYDGEYFIYHATTSSNEYFLSKMKIDINNMVFIETK